MSTYAPTFAELQVVAATDERVALILNGTFTRVHQFLDSLDFGLLWCVEFYRSLDTPQLVIEFRPEIVWLAPLDSDEIEFWFGRASAKMLPSLRFRGPKRPRAEPRAALAARPYTTPVLEVRAFDRCRHAQRVVQAHPDPGCFA